MATWTNSEDENKTTQLRQFGFNSLENGKLLKPFKQTDSDRNKVLLI